MNQGVGKKEAMKNKGKKRVVSGDKWENGVMEAGKNGEGKKRTQKEGGGENPMSINFSVLSQLNNGWQS